MVPVPGMWRAKTSAVFLQRLDVGSRRVGTFRQRHHESGRARDMSGRIAKIVNSWASFLKVCPRDVKAEWYRLNAKERGVMRKHMERGLDRRHTW